MDPKIKTYAMYIVAIVVLLYAGYYYGSTREISIPGVSDTGITSRIDALERDNKRATDELKRSTEALDRSTRRIEALEVRVGRIAEGLGDIQSILSNSDGLIGEAAVLVDRLEQRFRGLLEDSKVKN